MVGKQNVLHSIETFDAGLVALESIILEKVFSYYSTLRCRTLPSKENFPRQLYQHRDFLQQIFLSPVQCLTFLPTKGCDQNFLLLLSI